MRRTVLTLAALAAMSLLLCGVALAAAELPELVGTAGNDEIMGTQKAELIKGLAGRDEIHARGGEDVVRGGPHNDTIVIARDISDDRASCGEGRNDTVVADPNDRVDGVPAREAAANPEVTCENVTVVVSPGGPPSS